MIMFLSTVFRRPARPRSRGPSEVQRGFTLVELMVALTGGLFFSIFVFMLARDSARFFQQESRLASATMATVTGFQRLRADIQRAGFLSTPNILSDTTTCPGPAANGWANQQLLRSLASVQIVPGGSLGASPVFAANGLTPDRIILMGSYSSPDQFPVRVVEPLAGGGARIWLQVQNGAMARLGYITANAAARTSILQTLFQPGRALRVLDHAGNQHFGVIVASQAGNDPFVDLSGQPAWNFSDPQCGFRGFEVGAQANVVNFIQYELLNLSGDPTFAPLYTLADAVNAAPPVGEPGRTELVRTELDANGGTMAGSAEVVAEYAVDLRFGVTAVTNEINGALTTFAPGAPQVANFAADIWNGGGAAATRPDLIRAMRVRLSTRSRSPDREATIPTNPGDALYRIDLGNNAFARVRTLQSDIALRNR